MSELPRSTTYSLSHDLCAEQGHHNYMHYQNVSRPRILCNWEHIKSNVPTATTEACPKRHKENTRNYSSHTECEKKKNIILYKKWTQQWNTSWILPHWNLACLHSILSSDDTETQWMWHLHRQNAPVTNDLIWCIKYFMVSGFATKSYTFMDRFKTARNTVVEDASTWFGYHHNIWFSGSGSTCLGLGIPVLMTFSVIWRSSHGKSAKMA